MSKLPKLICFVFFIYRKGYKLINSIFRSSSTLHIPLPIPLLKQKELRCSSLSYENKAESFATILNDKSSADLVFICREDEHYYCHRMILCSRVRLFRELFGLQLDHDSMSVKLTGEVSSLKREVLKTTSLFEEASVTHSSHHW